MDWIIADIPPGANTGDGHKMGLWIGAAMQNGTPHAPMIHNIAGILRCYGFLFVNKDGLRYSNEDVSSQGICIAKMVQPGNIAWTIFDDNYLNIIPKILPVTGGFSWDQGERGWEQPWSPDVEKGLVESQIKKGVIVTANTIEDLAQKMKVPANNLKATVDRYNEMARAKKDLDFGRRAELLYPIEKTPFYAGLMKSALLTIVGGLSVNTNMQVLDTKGNVIPGLYAAGNVAGDFFAIDYPTILPGHSHGRCITFGRIAGLSAAAERA